MTSLSRRAWLLGGWGRAGERGGEQEGGATCGAAPADAAGGAPGGQRQTAADCGRRGGRTQSRSQRGVNRQSENRDQLAIVKLSDRDNRGLEISGLREERTGGRDQWTSHRRVNSVKKACGSASNLRVRAMEGGSAVQRLRHQFEVLDGLARASPAGPVRPSPAADSARPGGRKSPGAAPAAVQSRRLAGVGGPAAAAGAAAGSGTTGSDGDTKSASVPSSVTEKEGRASVTKSPIVLKRTPAVVIKSPFIPEPRQAVKTDSTTALNATANGSRSPGSGPRLCNGVHRPSSPAVPTAAAAAAPVVSPAPSPTPGAEQPPSAVAAGGAPPRPPKPGSDTSSASGDADGEPGDYLVPDGVPPVPPREPLSPEWGGTRSPLVRRSLPPPPPSGARLQQQAWFHSVDRAGARALILRRGNGAFVVRPSQRGGAAAPFALTLLHAGQVYNFNVRQRSDGRFALGYHKKDEASFRSVEELVRHHQREPISLPTKARTCLTWYPNSGLGSP